MGCTASKESSSIGTLYYFRAYSRGEPLRMLLNYKKVKFEDFRMTGEQYGALRKSGELKTAVPVWVENGCQMNQLGSLLRYHGRKLGLFPKDENLAWECDSYYDFHEDQYEKLVTVFMKGASVKVYEEAIQNIINEIGRRLEHGKKYLCGDNITTADFVAAHCFFSWILNDSLGGPVEC